MKDLVGQDHGDCRRFATEALGQFNHTEWCCIARPPLDAGDENNGIAPRAEVENFGCIDALQNR
jgi:hypothetical protein